MTMRASGCAAAILLGLFAAQASAQLQIGGLNGGTFVVLNSATQGQPYSYQFTATGGTPPYRWTALPPSGEGFISLPSGLSLNPTGLLSGSPTTQIPRTSYFMVSLTDSSAEPQSAQVPVGIKIFPPLPLAIQAASLPGGTTNDYYSAALQATGGVPPYSFGFEGLPRGLTATPAGAITGVAQTAGSYAVSVTLTDAAEDFITAHLTLNIYAPPPLTAAGSTATVTIDLPFSAALSASGGNGPYTWSLASGSLPAGLTLHAAGYIDGTPTVTGQYSFSLEATDTQGQTATTSYSIQVNQPPLAPVTGALPLGYVSVPYQEQILNVSGGMPPYTFSLQPGSTLPAGLTLTGGVISGVPSAPAQGQQFTIVATDSSSLPVSIPITFTLTIAAQPVNADLTLNTAALSFTTNAGSQTAPASQNIVPQSTDASVSLSFSVSVSPAAPWLQILSGAGATPDSIGVSINQSALPPPSATPYTTTVSIECATCSPTTQTVTVSLLVTALPGTLSVAEPLVSFVSAGPAPLNSSITVRNVGGGALGIGEIVCGAPWCEVGSFSYSVPGGASAAVEITVDPSTLKPGFYRTAVTVQSSGGTVSVPVDLLLANGSLISLDPAAVRFDMVQGSAPPQASRSFAIGVPAGAAINWTAEVLPGAPWLQLGTQSGTATPATPGVVKYSIVPLSGSQAPGVGAYYGTIRVRAAGAADSPFDFEVVLDVKATTDAAEIDPEPAGILFVTAPGVNPPDQGVSVYTTSAKSIPYSSAVTAGDGNWLSVSQPAPLISVNSPDDSDLGVATGSLGPGVYSNGITYSVSGGEARTVNVTLVVQPVTSGQSGGAERLSAMGATGALAIGAQSTPACSPALLAPTQTGLANNFSAPAAWPTPLAILLVDNCGNAVANGQVVTTFSNGDPPLALPLVDAAQGLYSATWTPRAPGSEINVVARATAPGFADATALITGAVPPNAAPLLAPDGAVHPFNPETGGPLAPGTIIAIYGSNLAGQTGQPPTIPLPISFNNTSVIIGGIPAPLFYVSASQINAQIPYELAGGNEYQVIVTANNAISAPETIQLAQATPGIAALPGGPVIAQHGDGTLVSATSPAKPGEYLVMYLLGLGDTNTPVTTGAASPASPLAQPLTAVTLLLNNNSIPVAFAGLTPGLVGLYQLNFQVPAGLAAGTYSLQVEQGPLASNTVTLPVQP